MERPFTGSSHLGFRICRICRSRKITTIDEVESARFEKRFFCCPLLGRMKDSSRDNSDGHDLRLFLRRVPAGVPPASPPAPEIPRGRSRSGDPECCTDGPDPMRHVRRPVRLRHLPACKRARSPVANLALFHQHVERLDGLVERNGRIVAVELVEVDPVSAEPPQARLHAAATAPDRSAPAPSPR